MQMSAYVNQARPRVPTELTVPMSAKSTPRARGGLCLAAGICPGWVEGMMAVGQTGARHPWISLFRAPALPPVGRWEKGAPVLLEERARTKPSAPFSGHCVRAIKKAFDALLSFYVK